ncbi:MULTISPECIES: branched-chain amino acid ABC transporter permease [Rhodococcus]|uniref:Amino-acid transmembrane lipoprotein ABC transporter n=3 Tax=Rhodococcus TaxID=1827 RepID=M2YQB2_9NOCA|nr:MULTISPECIES: branched-chain amino acid ABC transporter permease [Rhodococcus]EME57032.1 amino-acid transmembrane lipoprotein ABC transporter [Rhodococcus ruber BKS 20-38]KOS56244.1 amino acid ABC transporter permease [Rhodococcus rhodochrous KG-21]MDM7489529.1 branched-chain amino acid ABC transporter permease [Rhodococcus indonesiensis]MDO1479421.1 branched-chain amino acid ABC transporter permease [Rhodococcus ruber]
MSQLVIDALVLGSIYLLFCLGMSISWGTIDILNFAHGGIFMFSAFVASQIVSNVGLGLVTVCLISVVVGAALSAAIDVFAFQPILRRAKNQRTAELQILIGGIGIGTIPVAIVQFRTLSEPFGFVGSSYETSVYTIGGLRLTSTGLIVLGCALILTLAISFWLKNTSHGLALRAIGVDSETAELMGVKRRQLSLLTMAVSGGLAGLAGALLTYNLGAITAESGETLLIKAFAIIILGGVGSTGGAALGAMVLAFSEVLVLRYTGGGWVDAVGFGLILAVLLLRPQGIFGRKEVRRV